MKADMNAKGVITITPETGAEAFALQHWVNRNQVNYAIADMSTMEKFHYRGSGLVLQQLAQETGKTA
jgi:hypothetical protein